MGSQQPRRVETVAVHAGGDVDPETQALAPPLHLTTTFEHPPDVSLLDGYLYQRYTNPTQERLESALAAIENEAASATPPRALFFATGMAAASALIARIQPKHRVVLADDTYFAVRRWMQLESQRVGFECQLVDLTNAQALDAAFRQHVDLVWMETPSNPLLKVTDIAKVCEGARRSHATTVVDGTFATPLLQKPLSLGADIVLHSTTKYIAGHSDCMGGALITRNAAVADQLFEIRKLQGGTASPWSAWLTLRGIRTLSARLAWQCRSARVLADALHQHPGVAKVHFPGLPSHPQHAVATQQMREFGAMLSFELKGSTPAEARNHAIATASHLTVFRNATSLGSVESLVEHRQSTEGPSSLTPPGLLRLSVGLEAVDDLLDDLHQALAKTFASLPSTNEK
jgi:cystathionine gamma-synthase